MAVSLQDEYDSLKSIEPHLRGKAFEVLLSRILEAEGIRHQLAYRPPGEEIDGAFWWSSHTFLLEAKWRKNPESASSIYAFKGKVDGKLSGTLGVFVSMSGFSEKCIDALTHGKDLNIVLFDGSDVEAIISGARFSDVLAEKLFAAGQTGEVYLSWLNLRHVREATHKIRKARAASGSQARSLLVLCEGRVDEIILRSLIEHVVAVCLLGFSSINFLIAQGKRRLFKATAPAIAALASSGVSDSAAILVVFDSDTSDAAEIATQRFSMLSALAEDLPASWAYHVAVAIPEIETWIGASERLTVWKLLPYLELHNWDQRIAAIEEIRNLVDFLVKAANYEQTHP